jgi:serine phosphatase RsbU (regulator of sigma subunit)
MLKEIFNSQNYYWNPHSTPLLIVGLMVFLEGLFVCSKGKNRLVNRMFFLWLITVVSWLWGFGLVQMSKTYPVAMYWYKHMTLLGVVFISFGSYLFSLTWLVKDFSGKKNLITILFLILFGVYLSSFWGNLFVKEMRRYFWGYYPYFGIVGRIFLVLWIGLFVQTLINLVLAFRQSAGIKKKQLFHLIISIALAYIGAVDFVPIIFGIKLYPFGYMPVVVCITYMAYNIIRFKVMEIDTVIHRTILWVLTSGLILIPIGVLLYFIRPWLANLSWLPLTFVVTVLFYFYLHYYHSVQPRIDHLFRRRKYEYQTILGRVAEKIATTINLEDLAGKLLTEVCEAMYLRNSLIYVFFEDEQKYCLIGRRGYKEISGIRQRASLEIYNAEMRTSLPPDIGELNPEDQLYQWLSRHRDMLEKDQVEASPEYEKIKEAALAWFGMHDIELMVPLIFENKVTAILGLGKKENLQAYTAKDIELLKKLGQEVGVTLFNSLHYEDLVEKERLDEEMKMGRQIQMALLPQSTPQVSGLIVSGLMLPAKEIGGDYYDFITLPRNDQLAVIIGDVSGKGVGAGLIMSLAKATIYAFSQEESSPRQILTRTNYALYHHIAGQKFMTLLYMLWQPQIKTLVYSSAGHEHVLIYHAGSDEVESVLSGGFMLGMLADIDNFLEERQIKLDTKDKVLLYTDGITEALNESGERFGLETLIGVFKKYGRKPTDELVQLLKDEVFNFIGSHPQYDDITLVVLEAQ